MNGIHEGPIELISAKGPMIALAGSVVIEFALDWLSLADQHSTLMAKGQHRIRSFLVSSWVSTLRLIQLIRRTNSLQSLNWTFCLSLDLHRSVRLSSGFPRVLENDKPVFQSQKSLEGKNVLGNSNMSLEKHFSSFCFENEPPNGTMQRQCVVMRSNPCITVLSTSLPLFFWSIWSCFCCSIRSAVFADKIQTKLNTKMSKHKTKVTESQIKKSLKWKKMEKPFVGTLLYDTKWLVWGLNIISFLVARGKCKRIV